MALASSEFVVVYCLISVLKKNVNPGKIWAKKKTCPISVTDSAHQVKCRNLLRMSQLNLGLETSTYFVCVLFFLEQNGDLCGEDWVFL